MTNDIILIDKPAGWTSFDVVAKLRGSLKARFLEKGIKPTKRQLRVGHAGTLDPFATGLLVILYGNGCKKADEFLKLDKTYEAIVRLGAISSTGDPEGAIIAGPDQTPVPRQAIEDILPRFTGEITQIPSIYSAIKIDGVRAYKLAREGKSIDMPSRQVTIYSLEILEYTYPDLRVRAHVSSGTYIRSLAQDIGMALGVGAYCHELRRTNIDKWSVDEAHSIEQIDELAKSLSDMVQ